MRISIDSTYTYRLIPFEYLMKSQTVTSYHYMITIHETKQSGRYHIIRKWYHDGSRKTFSNVYGLLCNSWA